MNRKIYGQREISLKEFEKCGRISKKMYSYIYKIKNKETGEFYACKILDCCDDCQFSNHIITKIISKMIEIEHPTIQNYKWYSKEDFQGEHNVSLIMEFSSNGSLYDILEKLSKNDTPPNFTNTSRQKIIIGISRGMKHLHDYNILHFNLKPNNILIDSKYQPHITDFYLKKANSYNHLTTQITFIDSLSYRAPELFQNEHFYSEKSDVYSFAIIMYEIINNCKAFPELERGEILDYEFKNKILYEKYRPKFKIKIKQSIQNLIEQCWSDEPNKRPSFEEIFNKLSTKKDENNENFILDDVDEQELNEYLKIIEPKIIDENEYEINNKIGIIEEENQQLKESLNQLLTDEKNLFEEIKNKEDNFQRIKRINTELKTKNNILTNKLINIEQNYENLQNQLKQLQIENQQFDDELANIEKVHQQLKTDLSNLKIKEDDILISEFNELSLKQQQKITESLSKSASIMASQLFYKMNQLNLFLMKFDEINESCVEIISDKNTKLTEINEDSRIQIRSSTTENLFKNKSLTSTEFYEILNKFDSISIELKYPSNLFKSIYEHVINIINQETNKNNIKISLHISDITETDQTFCEDQNINYLKFEPGIKIIKGFENEIKSSFYECSSLIEITIPSSVTSIGEYAFSCCSSLKRIRIPSSITSIEKGIFFKCFSLVQIEIPTSVKSIGDYAFFRCSSLEEITIPSSVNSIGEYAFSGCSSLKQITIPSSVTSIEFGVFFRCSSLEKINLSSTLKSIGYYSFYECTSLKQISIPSTVISIEENSFQKNTEIIKNKI